MSNLDNILSHSDCLKQEQLQHYLENKLEKEEVYSIEIHLIDCMFCSDALEGLQILDAETNEANIADIRKDVTALLKKEDDKAALITKTETASPSKLTAQKGGKRISWAAVAGIFFLVFGGGLVVFSYINNNSDWFGNKGEQYSKVKSTMEGNSEMEAVKKRSPEFENISIEAADLPGADLKKEKKVAKSSKDNIDFNNSKKTINKNIVKKSTVEEESNDATETRKEIIAKATTPKMAQSPSSRATQDIGISQEKDSELVTKNENQRGKQDLSSLNTYYRPKSEAGLKDINGINDKENKAIVAKSKKRSKKDVSIAGGRADETAYMIDKVQTQGAKKKTRSQYYSSLELGNEAYGKKEYKTSIKYYKKALRSKTLKNRNEVLFKLALAYEKTNNISRAEKIYEQLEDISSYKKSATEGLRRVRARR